MTWDRGRWWYPLLPKGKAAYSLEFANARERAVIAGGRSREDYFLNHIYYLNLNVSGLENRLQSASHHELTQKPWKSGKLLAKHSPPPSSHEQHQPQNSNAWMSHPHCLRLQWKQLVPHSGWQAETVLPSCFSASLGARLSDWSDQPTACECMKRCCERVQSGGGELILPSSQYRTDDGGRASDLREGTRAQGHQQTQNRHPRAHYSGKNEDNRRNGGLT